MSTTLYNQYIYKDGDWRLVGISDDGSTLTNIQVNGVTGVVNNRVASVTVSVPTKTSDLTNDSGFITSDSDEKVKTAAVTSATTYYPVVGTNTTNAATKYYDSTGFKYAGTNGTTSTIGTAKLYLGNTTASGTTNNKKGQLVLYGSTANAVTIDPGDPTGARTITLPNATGTVALTSDIPTVPDAGSTASAVGTTASGGSAETYSKSDHVHNLTSSTITSALGYTPASVDDALWPKESSSVGDLLTYVKISNDVGDYIVLGAGGVSGSDGITQTRSAGNKSVTLKHSNSVTAQTTQAVYPIKIDAQGHISAYGTAVTSMTPSSHTHGDLTNGGDITATATIANGDRIIINDESASKITNSSITFGTSTTSFLANNGTWQTPSDSDQNVTSTAVTGATTYYLTGSTNSATETGGLSKHASASMAVSSNSGSGGYARLVLGNDTATTSTGGKEGVVRLYGTSASYYVDLKAGAPSSTRTITFPNATGTVALTSDVTDVTYNSSSHEIRKTVLGTVSTVVSASTLKTDMAFGAAADKGVDTSITSGSTSTNLPTTAAVVNYVAQNASGTQVSIKRW